MAIQWMDDFSSYGTDVNKNVRLLDGPYAAAVRFDLQADPDLNGIGAQVLRGFGGGLGGDFRKVLNTPQTTVGMASRVWLASLPSIPLAGICPHVFKDTNNNVHITIMINPSGYIEAYRNAYSDGVNRVLLGTSASPAIGANGWRHIETKVLLDNAAGTVEVRVEGVTVLNLSGIRTTSNIGGAGTTCGMACMMSPQDSGQPAFYSKDLIVWDGSGTANTNFLGSCTVYKIIPQSDASLNWATSAGSTGYNLINETTPDDDATYIQAGSPAPAAAQFNMTDLPTNVTSVKGVMTMHRSKKTDGGDGNITASVISGANTGVGANRPITTAYTYNWDVFDKDPSGSAWSKTLVNALLLKLDRTL